MTIRFSAFVLLAGALAFLLATGLAGFDSASANENSVSNERDDPSHFTTVNGVLGDESFVAMFGRLPGPNDAEDLRLRTHLAYVEQLLRARKTEHLTRELQEARLLNLDRLHDYWTAGIYPRNTVGPDHRNAVFIDEAGRICAVGYLFEQDRGRGAAERVNASFQTATIFEIDDQELGDWLASSGLSQEEAAMIQPLYGPYVEYMFDFTTSGATSCGTNENPTPIIFGSDQVTMTDMERMPGLSCSDAIDDVFESTGFLVDYDPLRSIRYEMIYDGTIERPMNGFFDFEVWRSATGPTEGRVLVSIDNGASFDVVHEFAISTTPATENVFYFFSPDEAPPGSDVMVAFEARGGDPVGSLILNNVVGINGYTPVELSNFNATVNGDEVTVQWVTSSETNNAGFEVQMRGNRQTNYRALGFVEGHGTTTEVQSYTYSVSDMEPGAYSFRLKQIDFDGAFEYSDEIEVAVSVPGTHLLTQAYPNPFNPQAQFSLSVAQTQAVDVGVYDALGRRVLNLFNGILEGGRAHPFALDGRGLSTGLLFIRATGSSFAASQSVILLR